MGLNLTPRKNIQDLFSTPQASPYRQVRRQDGGYDFFNGGNKINVNQYVQGTGVNKANLVQSMANSGDRYSQNYVQQQRVSAPQITAHQSSQNPITGVTNFLGDNLIKPIVSPIVNTVQNASKLANSFGADSLNNSVQKATLAEQKQILEDQRSGKISWDEGAKRMNNLVSAASIVKRNANQKGADLQAIDPVKAAADAAGTYLNIATLGNGKAIVDNLGRAIVNPLAKRVAVNATTNGLLGGGFNVLNTVSQEGKNTNPLDVVVSAATGLGTGAVVGAGGTLIKPVVQGAVKGVKNLTNDVLASKPADYLFGDKSVVQNAVANKAKVSLKSDVPSPQVTKTPPEIQGKPLYRGINQTEWDALQNGQTSHSVNRPNHAFVGSDPELAQMAAEAQARRGRNSYIVEYKPGTESKVTSGGSLGHIQNPNNIIEGEYLGKNLGLNDIAKVTDSKGNVIYDATTPQVTKTPVTPELPQTQTQKTFIEPVKNGSFQEIKKGFSDADQVILDELKNIEKQTGQKGLVDKFMYKSNMQRGSNAEANVELSNSENIQKAFSGMKKNDYKAFSDYANARAELSTVTKKTSTSLPREELKARVANASSDHQARFEALNQHYKTLATVWHDAGVIDDKTFKFYQKNNDYIRLQRDMGDKIPNSFGGKGGYQLGSTTAKQHRLGSTKATLDVGSVTAERTQQVYREATRNKTGVFLADSLEKAGLARKVTATEASSRNTMSIFRKGVKEHYEVSPEMKKAVDNINPYSMNVVMQILALPGRIARAGITGFNPIFITRNLLKDQIGTAINSKHLLSTHNPKTFFNGLFEATKEAVGAKNSPLYLDFMRHYGNMTSFDLTRNAKNASQIINRVRGGKLVGVGQSLKSPIRTLENFFSITEKSTRFQNFSGEYKKAISQGLSREAASERAAISAWQNSVDFSRAGTWGRTINTVIPYWNPASQGVRQMARTVTAQPVKSLLTATGIIGVPLAAATAWNLTDPETAKIYNNIPEYEKENNLILIPPGTKQNEDGTYDVIKIPLTPGWKDAFMPVRRALESYYNQKPVEFDKMAQDILQTVGGPVNFQSPGAFAGSFIPQAVKPIVQQAANQDLFSGNTIVPDYIQQATDSQGNPIAENQKAYTNTSGTARKIGDLFNVSPVRVEKAIKDTLGTVGLQGLNAVDTGLAKTGLIPQNQIGGQSVATGYKKSFGQAQGIVNANQSEGAKHFAIVKQATAGLNGNELAAYNSIHPQKKNFVNETIYDKTLFDTQDKAATYLRYPGVFEADKKTSQLEGDSGKPTDPLYDLTPEQQKVIFTMQANPSDEPMSKKLTKDNPWLTDYYKQRSTFFDTIKSTQTPEEQAKAGIDPNGVRLVIADDNMQKKLTTLNSLTDKKMKSKFYEDNPDVIDFYKQKDEYDRYKRKAMGFPLYDKYPEPSPETQKVMDFYNKLPKGDGPAKKDGTASSPTRSNWIKSHPNEWASLTDYYNVKAQYDLAQAGSNAVYEGEGFNADDYKDMQSIVNAGGGGSSGSSWKNYGGGGGGGKANDPTLNAYKYAISLKAGGSAPKAITSKAKVGALKKSKVGVKGATKPKVTMKKSLV